MTAAVDSLKTRRTLKVGNRRFDYFSLKAAEKNGLGDLSRLPYSLKVLLENLLRNEDGRSVARRTSRPLRALAEDQSAPTARSPFAPPAC